MVSTDLLLNAMKNPVCVNDLQDTHLVNNFVPLSSQTQTCLSSLHHAIAVLLNLAVHLLYLQHDVSSD